MMNKLGYIKSLIILASILMLSGEVGATENATKDAGWGAWQALSSGFVARRKQPPFAKLPRQLSAQQSRGGAKRESGRGGINGIWLKLRGEGLAAVAIADAAFTMGVSAEALRELASKGKLSLLNRGRPVSWYYDSGDDRILFAAQALDSFYTDENAYYLSLDTRDARPMPVALLEYSDSDPAAPEGMAFVDTIHFEEEPPFKYATWSVADNPEADYWYWDYLFAGSRDEIKVNLELPDPAQEGRVWMHVGLRGFTDTDAPEDHHVRAQLEGAEFSQSVVFDGFDDARLTLDFDGSLLQAGGNNTLVLTSEYEAGQTTVGPGEWLDFVDVSYLRKPVARDGRLWIHNSPYGMQRVRGFDNKDIVIIESPAEDAQLRPDGIVEPDGNGGWSISFYVREGKDYLVAQADSAIQPRIVPDYRYESDLSAVDADYLIIAPRIFSGTAGRLQRYHEQQGAASEGTSAATLDKVQIVWLEDIYSEFSDGIEDPHAITRFMNSIMENPLSRHPKQVVLVGKGTLDHKDRMGYGDSFLPVLLDSTPWSLAASDARLLAGEDEPGFAIGRLPITSDAEGMAYVDKLAAYEDVSGERTGRAVVVADNPDKGGDFVHNSDLLADRLIFELGMSEVEKLYHPDDPVRDLFTQSATWEVDYVNYDGHGSTAQLGDRKETFIAVDDAASLANSRYPLFTALTCAAGDDSQPGMRSLASSLVLNPNGGAIAALAPTGLSLDAEAQLLGDAFTERLFIDGEGIGEAIRSAHQDTAGDISAFMSRVYSVIGDPAVKAPSRQTSERKQSQPAKGNGAKAGGSR